MGDNHSGEGVFANRFYQTILRIHIVHPKICTCNQLMGQGGLDGLVTCPYFPLIELKNKWELN